MGGAAPEAGPPAWRPFLAEPLDGAHARVEPVAVEEPLEIRVRGIRFATLLRTPGRERDLIAGFLAAERVLRGREDLGAIEPCAPPPGEEEARAWNVALAEGVVFDPARARELLVGSACGACGARLIADLRRDLPHPPTPVADPGPRALREAMRLLRARQALFAQTAGAHGAALARIGAGAEWIFADLAEDVGRHNAVDKLLGAALRAGSYPLEEPAWLLVSGRLSYEIVLKAALAGVGAVAGAGMPTSLAVEAARACGLRLHAFIREDGGLAYRA